MNAFFALRALLFAGEVLLGSLPIMAFAFLGAVQKRASARHLAYAGAFGALALLPVLAALVPSPIHILLPAAPQPIPDDMLSNAAFAAALPAPVDAGLFLDPATIALVLAVLWLAGALFLALRFGVGAWCLARLKQKSRPFALAPDDMPKIAAQCRECELRLARDDTGPITWGMLEPVILLPKTATFWPRERLHAVLLHELAHIRRRDSLVQAFALAVCAVYWPNPLVWMGARALRREAEIAADDSVIVAGMKPSSYAGELVRLADEFRTAKPALATLSLYMAERSSLETAHAQREAHEAMERARPEMDRAMAELKNGELRIKINEDAMRAVREAQPEIDAALRNVGPDVERALAKAQEDLKNAHSDMNIRAKLDKDLRDAQVKIDLRGDRDHDTDHTAQDNNTPDDN